MRPGVNDGVAQIIPADAGMHQLYASKIDGHPPSIQATAWSVRSEAQVLCSDLARAGRGNRA
jgi:hypothetical protein